MSIRLGVVVPTRIPYALVVDAKLPRRGAPSMAKVARSVNLPALIDVMASVGALMRKERWSATFPFE